MSVAIQHDFAVGYGNKAYGQWRKLTAAEWIDPAWQSELVTAHQQGGGWPLLEEPFECHGELHVAEGQVGIGDYCVTDVGHVDTMMWPQGPQPRHSLRGVYPATHCSGTNIFTWNTTLPAVGSNWSVGIINAHRSQPTLFVRMH